jgi:hypothetical protein
MDGKLQTYAKQSIFQEQVSTDTGIDTKKMEWMD